MVVIVDVRVPTENLHAGEPLDLPFDVELTFERTVSQGRAEAVPFVWVRTTDFEAFERAVRGHSEVTNARAIHERRDRRLYRIDWTSTEEWLDAVTRTDAAVVEGKSDDAASRLRLRFPDDASVTRFGRLCAEGDVSITPVSIHRRVATRREYGLTREQRETLLAAHECGYFDVPRKATLMDIAEELDVSDQAVSERIRRGVRGIVDEVVVRSTREPGSETEVEQL